MRGRVTSSCYCKTSLLQGHHPSVEMSGYPTWNIESPWSLLRRTRGGILDHHDHHVQSQVPGNFQSIQMDTITVIPRHSWDKEPRPPTISSSYCIVQYFITTAWSQPDWNGCYVYFFQKDSLKKLYLSASLLNQPRPQAPIIYVHAELLLMCRGRISGHCRMCCAIRPERCQVATRWLPRWCIRHTPSIPNQHRGLLQLRGFYVS